MLHIETELFFQRVRRASPCLSLPPIWEAPTSALVMGSLLPPQEVGGWGRQLLKQGFAVCSLEKKDMHASIHA